MAKLHDLPTLPSIDQANVIPRVVMVHNEKENSQLKGALACWYQPHKLLFDSNAQSFMLGKVVVEGFGLTNVDFEQCPYQILTSMGGLEKAQGLTKKEIVM